MRMRRHMASKDFKGSVFVELASVEEADKVRFVCVRVSGGCCLYDTEQRMQQACR